MINSQDFSHSGSKKVHDVFISHKTKDFEAVNEIAAFLVNKGLSPYCYEDAVDLTAENSVLLKLQKELENSKSLLVFLTDIDDFKGIIEYEYLHYKHTCIFKRRSQPEVIPVIKGQVNIDELQSKLGYHYLVTRVEENNYLDNIFTRLTKKFKTKHEPEARSVFIYSGKGNSIIDIPINHLLYWGLPRYQMDGLFTGLQFDAEAVQRIDDNINPNNPGRFIRRKWHTISGDYLSNSLAEEIFEQSDELTGIVITMGEEGCEIEASDLRKLENFKEALKKYNDILEPVIALNIRCINAPAVVDVIRGSSRFSGCEWAITQSEYRMFFQQISNRRAWILALRDTFSGRMDALEKVQQTRIFSEFTPIARIIELGKDYNNPNTISEKRFLETMNNEQLLTALLCGYKFKTSFYEIAERMKKLKIMDEMFALLVLCSDPGTIDLEMVTRWSINKRKHLGLLTPGEVKTHGRSRDGLFSDSYFFSLFKHIIQIKIN